MIWVTNHELLSDLQTWTCWGLVIKVIWFNAIADQTESHLQHLRFGKELGIKVFIAWFLEVLWSALNMLILISCLFLLGLIHNRHFCSQYCNKKIEVKRYCDKKDIFHPKYFFPVCIEIIFLGTILNILKKKISFYQNVFLSFNRNIVCKNVSCE